MNPPNPSNPPRNNTELPEKHLRNEGIERACGPESSTCVPLVCNEDECFIPASELDATIPEETPTPAQKPKSIDSD